MRFLLAAALCAFLVACSATPSDTSAPPDAGESADASSSSADAATPPSTPADLTFERRFVTGAFQGCLYASPLSITSRGQPFILVASLDGTVAALDPQTGATAWSVKVPVPAGETANLASTPGILGTHAVVTWQTEKAGQRVRHLAAVIDLEARALDPAFPTVELSASKPDADGTGTVSFLPAHAYARSDVITAKGTHQEGVAYVSHGNIRDLQPWHGWVFELDLDQWKAQGASKAVSGVLLTTPESACGPENSSGARGMVCGGGVWSPAGVVVHEDASLPGGYEVFVPTGNGALNVNRRDYANTVMRTGPGLAFDPACDSAACANFDPSNPSPACIESCRSLFVPRLNPGTDFINPARCNGLSFMDCYAELDWDLGANSPTRVELPGGKAALVLPAKDGGLYLVDAGKLGTLFDRKQLAKVCGEDGGHCDADWAGMMATQPAIAEVDGTKVAVVPTFEFDTNHPAGIVAVDVDASGATPKLKPRWQVPSFDSVAAMVSFRGHTGRPTILNADGQPFALVVDVRPGSKGTLWAVRVSDGKLEAQLSLDGPGRRFVKPLVTADAVYTTSCGSENGDGHVEAWSWSVKR